MDKCGYSRKLSTGVVASVGTLGILLPPSGTLIILAMITNQSIGKLFFAGIIPGLLIAALFLVTIVVWCRVNPSLAPRGQAAAWKERARSVPQIFWPLLIFAVTVGGLLAGFFTPTEAGAIGATVLFLVTILKRKLTGSALFLALTEAVRISTMVLMLVAGANVFSYFLALSTIPMKVASWAAALEVSPYLIHTIIVIIYLFLGCFLDAISMMVLTMPVIYPVILALGFNPIWFGVIAVLMMEAGLITPPMGLNIFTVAGVAKDVPIETIFRGVAPFLLSIFAIVILITMFPKLALFLPNMMLR